MPKLKVYRTPIGFHDAYVAATSQKAALDAWGADVNLFARGVAEAVTDAALTKEPLANPGTVIRRPRGTAAEHLAALPKDEPKQAAKAKPSAQREPRPKPRPDRSELDAAEQALDDARAAFDARIEDLRRRETELRQERRDTETRRDAELGSLQARADKARSRHAAAMEKWRR